MWFAKGEKQAARIMQSMQGKDKALEAVGTVRAYEAALARVANWQKEEHKAGREGGDLRSLTPEQAERYLEQRGDSVRQSSLNQDRQAIQAMQRHVTGHLGKEETLRVVKSELQQVEKSRSYSPLQINAIIERQTEKNALATQISHATGLRAHELLTIRPANEQPPDERPSRDEKFSMRSGEKYTVHGKGGLTREVMLPAKLAQRLEAQRLSQPQRINDRGIFYQSHYAIGGGQRWSNSFSKASNSAMGKSNGAHGLRHSYAQERMGELQRDGLHYRNALETVSQEMGHFRPDITEVYLR